MFVIDTSVVVDILLVPHQVTLPELGHMWFAPTTIDAELVSALLRNARHGEISFEQAQAHLEEFAQFGLRRYQLDPEIRRRMLVLGQRVSAYDSAYVAVAEALQAPLVTRDAPLARTASDFVECHLV